MFSIYQSIANIIESVPSTAYQYEVGVDASTTTYDAKVGLMYVSDYEFAANPSAWTLNGWNDSATKDYRAATSNNWMYMGESELTISRISNYAFFIAFINDKGNIKATTSNVGYSVRPVFNLESTVTFAGGSGTQSDPIRIN